MKTDLPAPELSVVAATYRRPRLLEALLASLEALTLPHERFEVIVVDDGSGDRTPELLAQWAQRGTLQLRHATQENAGPATARNRGAAMARAPLLAFIDDDCVASPTWLEEYRAHLAAHPELAGAGGLLRRKHDNLVARWVDHAVRMEHCVQKGETLILITANACYRKKDFEEAGGFDTRIPWAGGEDPDLARKVRANGGRLGVLPGSLVRHTHRDSVRGVYKDGKLIGMSRVLRMELGLYRDTPLPWSMAGMFYRHGRRALASAAPLPEKGIYLLLNAVKVAGFFAGSLAMRFRRNRGARGAELKESLGASNLKDSRHAKGEP
jgi:glycosyltransferase involved in cell wall biosynthesis